MAFREPRDERMSVRGRNMWQAASIFTLQVNVTRGSWEHVAVLGRDGSKGTSF